VNQKTQSKNLTKVGRALEHFSKNKTKKKQNKERKDKSKKRKRKREKERKIRRGFGT
jgi:hypothetical protein